LGDDLPKARGVNRLSLMPWYADAWMMRSLSVSKPLNSALASAPARIWSIFCAVLIGYRAAKVPCAVPCRWPSFFWCRRYGTGCFLAATLFRYVRAWSSVMFFMAVHTSWACLWDTLSSRPADLTVFAGSRSVMEYPHSGIVFGFSPDCANKLQRRSIYVLCV